MSDLEISETEEIFNRQISRGYTSGTWGHIGTSGGFMLLSCIVNPMMIFTLLAAAGSLSGFVRCVTMPKDVRAHANSGEVVAQIVISLGIALLTLAPLVIAWGMMLLLAVMAMVT